MTDLDTFGDEVVLRVKSTGKGAKVIRYDGTGVSDGYAGKSHLRYCYGDNATEKANDYAERKADAIRDSNWIDGKPVRVVPLGKRMAEVPRNDE